VAEICRRCFRWAFVPRGGSGYGSGPNPRATSVRRAR
jgi:hypothetical protein